MRIGPLQRNKSDRTYLLRIGLLILGASAVVASCYSFIGRYPNNLATNGLAPYVDATGQRHWYVEVKALNAVVRENYARELLDCAPISVAITPRDQLRAMSRPGQPRPIRIGDARADGSDLVFRVGFISDVHIRQPSVKLFNDKVSRSLDHLINSFERNGYEEAFSNAAYASIIAAFDQLDSTDSKPRLVINTGDATDAGTIEEAYDFVALTRGLRYPLLYALGNHDDAIFGNYKDWLGYTEDAGPDFYPVGQRVRFLKFLNRIRRIEGFSDALVPLPGPFPKLQFDERWGALDLAREEVPGVEPKAPKKDQMLCINSPKHCAQKSLCYGFDLNDQERTDLDKEQCDSYPGYYDVIVPGGSETTVQLISLNTTREHTWGEWSDFPSKQRDWLARELKRPATVTIVFMHHRSSDEPTLAALLADAAKTRPLVALSAHDHSNSTEWRGYWELNTGSIEEFPQWARLLEIRRAADKRFYLNSRILRPRLPLRESPGVLLGGQPAPPLDDWDQLPSALAPEMEAWFEKQFAACDDIAAIDPEACQDGKHDGKPCGDPRRCHDGTGTLLVDSAQCGYLGALHDHLFPAQGQTGNAAAAQVQVTLDISTP